MESMVGIESTVLNKAVREGPVKNETMEEKALKEVKERTHCGDSYSKNVLDRGSCR